MVMPFSKFAIHKLFFHPHLPQLPDGICILHMLCQSMQYELMCSNFFTVNKTSCYEHAVNAASQIEVLCVAEDYLQVWSILKIILLRDRCRLLNNRQRRVFVLLKWIVVIGMWYWLLCSYCWRIRRCWWAWGSHVVTANVRGRRHWLESNCAYRICPCRRPSQPKPHSLATEGLFVVYSLFAFCDTQVMALCSSVLVHWFFALD